MTNEKQLPLFNYLNEFNAEQAKSLAKQQKYRQDVELAEMQKRGLTREAKGTL